MLKPNEKAVLKWNSKNKKHYVDLGYKYTKMGDEFLVDTQDLTRYSKAKVKVICDYCGKELTKAYQTYVSQHDDIMGDCCTDCEQVKIQHTWLQKYGVTNVFQNNDVKEKIKQTCLEKYGTERACQSDIVKKKIRDSLYKNGTVKTSQQQIELCHMLKGIYGSCELNYPYSSCSLDCLIKVKNQLIDVEYDGWFWHKNMQNRDRKRDEFLKSNGYKILRIKANRDLPTKEQIIKAIDFLVNKNHRYTEIILDI